MGSNLQDEQNFGFILTHNFTSTEKHDIYPGVVDIKNTRLARRENKSPRSKTLQSDTEFTPIKNSKVQETINASVHPMERRSKPQRRALFSEEYLGNLDDYDFTDFAINDNAVKKKSRRKKQAGLGRCDSEQCDSGTTSNKAQLKVTSTAVSYHSLKQKCNTDITNNQTMNNATNKCTKASTTKLNNSFHESSKSVPCKNVVNNKKRCRENRKLKKNIKRRKLLHHEHNIAENRSSCGDFMPLSHQQDVEANAESLNTKTLIDTVALQDMSSHTEGLSCDFISLNQNNQSGIKGLSLDSNTTVKLAEEINFQRRDSTGSLGISAIDVKEPMLEKNTVVIAGKVVNKSTDNTVVDQSYSNEEYSAYSPDSGFVSESSSAASPSCENNDEFFNASDITEDLQKKIQDTKKTISRSSSSDSGVGIISPKESGKDAALILCGKSVKAAEKLKRDAEKKAEDEFLRQKFQCKWVNCSKSFEPRSSADLHNHLTEEHVKNIKRVCCKWKECKYFDQVVRKESWLRWHILAHTGEKPFKCIVNGCDASFVSRHGLERHVNSHYTEVTLPKAKVAAETNVAKLIIRRRKIQNERKALANLHDCMDNHTVGHMRYGLQVQEDQTKLQQSLFGERLELQPTVIGRKVNCYGDAMVLVSWSPKDILPNEWMLEGDLRHRKIVNQKKIFESKHNNLMDLFRCPMERPKQRRRK